MRIILNTVFSAFAESSCKAIFLLSHSLGSTSLPVFVAFLCTIALTRCDCSALRPSSLECRSVGARLLPPTSYFSTRL